MPNKDTSNPQLAEPILFPTNLKSHPHPHSPMPKNMTMKHPQPLIISPEPQNHVSHPGNIDRIFHDRIYGIQRIAWRCRIREGIVCFVFSRMTFMRGEDVEGISVLWEMLVGMYLKGGG